MLKTRIDIINKVKYRETITKLIHEYGIDKSIICRMILKKEKINEFDNNSSKKKIGQIDSNRDIDSILFAFDAERNSII